MDSDAGATHATIDQDAVIGAAIDGDRAAFSSLVARHRRELHVHCYRMVGSFDDADDLVQDAFVRAWRHRRIFDGSTWFRAWLYRIATNVCLDFLARARRRSGPDAAGRAGSDTGGAPSIAEMPWLQPYPDRLLDEVPASSEAPDASAIGRETIELVVVAALQVLPPSQRAMVVLRDVAGLSAAEAAGAVGLTRAAANSALQRGRDALRRRAAASRWDWRSRRDVDAAEADLVRRFVDAAETYDVDAMVALARADIRMTAPPDPRTWDGRDAFAEETEHGFGPGAPGELRCIPVRANRQPAVASYLRRWDEVEYRPYVLGVLRIEGAKLVELTSFPACVFAPFDLPPVLRP